MLRASRQTGLQRCINTVHKDKNVIHDPDELNETKKEELQIQRLDPPRKSEYTYYGDTEQPQEGVVERMLVILLVNR